MLRSALSTSALLKSYTAEEREEWEVQDEEENKRETVGSRRSPKMQSNCPYYREKQGRLRVAAAGGGHQG